MSCFLVACTAYCEIADRPGCSIFSAMQWSEAVGEAGDGEKSRFSRVGSLLLSLLCLCVLCVFLFVGSSGKIFLQKNLEGDMRAACQSFLYGWGIGRAKTCKDHFSTVKILLARMFLDLLQTSE